MAKKLDLKEIRPYKEADYYLIPLHRWNKTTTDPRTKREMERGKSPLHAKWRKKKYTKEEIEQHIAKGKNLGVRLRRTDLVIDVDPRNFPKGDNVLKRFAKDLELDLERYPRVETGSGGSHYYMTKPEDVFVRDSLEEYPGIEFKSYGRQVVAAGSIHPNKNRYRWDWMAPDLTSVGPAPAKLLRLIKRAAAAKAEGGGEHSPEEIAEMLEHLPTEDFAENDAWLKIMMAVHHASGGEARQEFIDWSIRDPKYAEDAWIIGRRWDSLSADGIRGAAVTHRTLHKELIDRDLGEHIPRTTAQDDFKDVEEVTDEEEEDLPEHEKKSPMERMNDRFCMVDEGSGNARIYSEATDPSFNPPRKYWKRYTPYNFETLFGHQTVQKGDRTIAITEAWLRWKHRRQVLGIVFDPEREHEGFLNLWRGWAIEPKKGDWSLLQELVLDVLCDGNEDAFEYVMNWAADMIQRPGQAAEVALCFQGAKGTGKGTFGRALAHIAGRHGMHISSPEHLTGRFNSHMRDCICLFADEAVAPYDNAANSRLKALITEPTIPVEGKGQDIVTVKNLVHIIMASNEEWFVPMSLADERRFFVSRVNTDRQGDKVFFTKLHRQLNNGGYAAMLWDLLNRDISKWRPRDMVPTTAAAIEQKVRSLPPISQWWFNILEEGQLPFQHEGEWDDIFAVKVFRLDVKESFSGWCKDNRINPGAMGRANTTIFTKALRGLCGSGFKGDQKMLVTEDRPDLTPHSDGRHFAYEIPCLSDCRIEFEKLLGAPYTWNAKE